MGIGTRVTTSWWTLVGLGVATWAGTWFAWGNDDTQTIPTECVTNISEDRIWNWIDRLGGWASYDPATNLWTDASGRVVGSSETEDSAVCSFVR